MIGKVYLVGAGPGDPELLTLKARRLLGEADVVLHDDLVNAEILQFVSPAANVQSVGKRCGRPSISQEEIHSRMLAYAAEGLIVVRLQGGDPLLFGRASEEMAALCEEGIEFEVVPGITAALGAAAMAGISLTDRRLASKVLFVSNHRRAGQDALLDSHNICSETTVVVYMPGPDYGELAAKLSSAGVSSSTPCLIVSCATCEQQEIHSTTLENLPKASVFASPTLVIVGEVARRNHCKQSSTEHSDSSAITGALK